MYKLHIPFGFTEATSVIRISDGACIPFDPDNTDYIAYLEWCKTNTPLPADSDIPAVPAPAKETIITPA